MSEACNIGPKGVASRWVGGVVTGALVIGAAAFLLLTDAPPIWRLALVVPLFVAFLSVFQAKDKT